MMHVRLSPQSRADLDGIWVYIAQESASQTLATRAIAAISDKFELLAKFPNIGKSLESALRAGVRVFQAGNYMIFYSVKAAEIRILRVIRVSRDAYAVFTDE